MEPCANCWSIGRRVYGFSADTVPDVNLDPPPAAVDGAWTCRCPVCTTEYQWRFEHEWVETDWQLQRQPALHLLERHRAFLSHDDPEVRAEGAWVLCVAAIEGDDVEALADFVVHGDDATRASALATLAQERAPEALRDLLLRRMRAEPLAQGRHDAARAAARLLDDEALGQQLDGEQDPHVISGLLSSRDIGPALAPALRPLTAHPEERVRSAARHRLVTFVDVDGAVEHWVDRLNHPHPHVRLEACWAVGSMAYHGADVALAVPDLVAAIGTENEWAALDALRSAAVHGTDIRAARPALEAALDGELRTRVQMILEVIDA